MNSMNEQEKADKELEVFEWMNKKGYDRRASKEIAPIIVKYLETEVNKNFVLAGVSGSLPCEHEWQYLPNSRISLKMCVKCREEVTRQ